MFSRPTEPEDGALWVVSWRDNFVHWMAWASWMHDAFGKRFFSEMLTVWDEWPPITGEMAAKVASDLKAWREANMKDKGGLIGRQLPRVNPHPPIWSEWPLDYVLKLEREEAKRRESVGYSFAQRPSYVWDETRSDFGTTRPHGKNVIPMRVEAFS